MSGNRKIISMGDEFTRAYTYIKPQEKNNPWLFEAVWFSTWPERLRTRMFFWKWCYHDYNSEFAWVRHQEQIVKTCVNAHPNCNTCVFLLKMHVPLQMRTNSYVQFHQHWNSDLKRPTRRCQKQNPRGWTFSGWILADGWHHTKKGASSIDRTWWDQFKKFVSTRAQNKLRYQKFTFGIWKSEKCKLRPL